MRDHELIEQLIALIERLYDETVGFLEREDDAQLWYNRGYANGMVQGLDEQGYGCRLRERVDPDPLEIIEDQRMLPWGKAYQHGFEMGLSETIDTVQRSSE